MFNKNLIGTSVVSRKIFQIKEWIKIHTPSIVSILEFIKHTIDSFIQLYNNYRFIVLFFFWIILNLVYKDYYALNTIAILFVASLSLVAKYTNFLTDRFFLVKDFSNGIKQLDVLIADCIHEYCLMNGLVSLTFISDAEETKMRTEVTNMVVAKLSHQLMLKLKTQYNENVVHEIIATRVYIIVMNFTIDINKDKPSSDNAPVNDQYDMSKFLTNNTTIKEE